MAAPNQLSISIRWARIDSFLLSSSRHPHPRQRTPQTEKPAPKPHSSTAGTAPQPHSFAAPWQAQRPNPPPGLRHQSWCQSSLCRSGLCPSAPRPAQWPAQTGTPPACCQRSRCPAASSQAAAGSSSEVLAGRRVRWQLPQASARQLQLTPARALHPPASARR